MSTDAAQRPAGGLFIGIDPGVKTGVAVWNGQRYDEVLTLGIVGAMRLVEQYARNGTVKLVVFEDARLRTWFGKTGRERAQGAGSIKRDCQIWADLLGDLGVPYKSVKPAAGATKWPADKWAKMTGWTARTSEHARDAAVLVWGMRAVEGDNRAHL